MQRHEACSPGNGASGRDGTLTPCACARARLPSPRSGFIFKKTGRCFVIYKENLHNAARIRPKYPLCHFLTFLPNESPRQVTEQALPGTAHGRAGPPRSPGVAAPSVRGHARGSRTGGAGADRDPGLDEARLAGAVRGPGRGDPTAGSGKRAVRSECSKPLASGVRASGWGGGVTTAKCNAALKRVSRSESAGSRDPRKQLK